MICTLSVIVCFLWCLQQILFITGRISYVIKLFVLLLKYNFKAFDYFPFSATLLSAPPHSGGRVLNFFYFTTFI